MKEASQITSSLLTLLYNLMGENEVYHSSSDQLKKRVQFPMRTCFMLKEQSRTTKKKCDSRPWPLHAFLPVTPATTSLKAGEGTCLDDCMESNIGLTTAGRKSPKISSRKQNNQDTYLPEAMEDKATSVGLDIEPLLSMAWKSVFTFSYQRNLLNKKKRSQVGITKEQISLYKIFLPIYVHSHLNKTL